MESKTNIQILFTVFEVVVATTLYDRLIKHDGYVN